MEALYLVPAPEGNEYGPRRAAVRILGRIDIGAFYHRYIAAGANLLRPEQAAMLEVFVQLLLDQPAAGTGFTTGEADQQAGRQLRQYIFAGTGVRMHMAKHMQVPCRGLGSLP